MSESQADKAIILKDEELTLLKDALRERESQNTEKDRAIQSLERVLKQKDTLISRQYEEIVRLRGIENTLAWRGVRRLFDFVERTLFPASTRRGRLFFRMLNFLKAKLYDSPQKEKGPSHGGVGGGAAGPGIGEARTEKGGAGGVIRAEEKSYSQKIGAELGAFKEMASVHDLPAIHDYWSEKFLMSKLRDLGIPEFWNLFVDPVLKLWRQSGRLVEIASLGSGNCDFELQIARQIQQQGIPFEMHCHEINPSMLARGKEAIGREGLLSHFRFIESDVNRVKFEQQYDVFIANHSLHHFVNLEHIFQSIRSAMRPDGYFVVNDMIGRNGHMLWPEAYALFAPLWSSLGREKKWNHQNRTYEETYPNWDYSTDGFEGIRAQDILPLLIQSFKFELFCAFNNITDLFIGRCFGPNFRTDDPKDLAFIDAVARLDETCIREGKITPTHLIAWMVLEKPQKAQFMDDLTPEGCIRIPSPGD
jgi:SAM-dependent methyltransferase